MQGILRIFFIIFGIGLVITVHEFGHFTACKIFGVRTPNLSIGFGPVLFSKKIGETNFQISALPLGGYTSMLPQDLNKLSYWQRMIILLAGIIFNILFAFFIFIILSFLSPGAPIAIINKIVPKSPAQENGLLPGDKILKVDHTEINDDPIILLEIIAASYNKILKMIISRSGNIFEVDLPVVKHPVFGSKIGFVGIYLKRDQAHGFIKFEHAIHNAYVMVKNLWIESWHALLGFFQKRSQRRHQEIYGPIMGVAVTGRLANSGNSYSFWL